jgi:hypothetical protein
MEKAYEKLWNEQPPTVLEVNRAEEALRYLKDYEDFGLPFVGGSLEMPYEWKRAINFAMRVRRDANWEIEKARAEQQRMEDEARQQNQG